MIETSKPLLDSNILIYAANLDSLYHHEAIGILEQYIHSGFFVSDLNLTEFFQVITDGRKK